MTVKTTGSRALARDTRTKPHTLSSHSLQQKTSKAHKEVDERDREAECLQGEKEGRHLDPADKDDPLF